MISLLQAALVVRAARTLPRRPHDVVRLVARPRGVVHVAVSPLTPSDRFIPVAGRTVCNAHTRRLSVLDRSPSGLVPEAHGRRVCARCLVSLAKRTDVPGLTGRRMSRDEESAAFELLTPAVVTEIAGTLTTVDETHELSRVAMVLFGLEPATPPARRTPAQAAVAEAHQTIRARRQRLQLEAMTPEEREAAVRAREVEAQNSMRVQANRRREAARDKAIDRRNRGGFLLPGEKQLLNAG